MFLLPLYSVPANNRIVARYATPTTLPSGDKYLTLDARYLSLSLSMFLLRRQPPPPDQIDTVLVTCANTNMYSCPPITRRIGHVASV